MTNWYEMLNVLCARTKHNQWTEIKGARFLTQTSKTNERSKDTVVTYVFDIFLPHLVVQSLKTLNEIVNVAECVIKGLNRCPILANRPSIDLNCGMFQMAHF